MTKEEKTKRSDYEILPELQLEYLQLPATKRDLLEVVLSHQELSGVDFDIQESCILN